MIEFLTPVSKTVLAHREVLPNGVLGKNIRVYANTGELLDLENVKFAILGVKENRSDVDFIGEEICFDEIRKSLYSLYPGNWPYNIIDMGDIEKGESIQDTHFAMKTVMEELLKKDITPLLLCGSQDLAYSQYRAYDFSGNMVNITNIDSKFDLGDADQPMTNKSFVGKIIVDKPYSLFNYSNIGYQSYYNSPEEIQLMEKLFFDGYRLGEVTADITLVEPVLRNSDMVFLDIGTIKSADLSYKNSSSPNGFDGREICAISRYAGISNKVKSFGIYELKDFKNSKSAAMLIAQIFWYFIEGFSFRVSDDDFSNETQYVIYKVPLENDVLIFKKSNKTGRWWMELPFFSNVNNKLKRETLLPCTYDDYLSACNQEMPERWIKARRKNEL
jgi:formiminoglutamase